MSEKIIEDDFFSIIMTCYDSRQYVMKSYKGNSLLVSRQKGSQWIVDVYGGIKVKTRHSCI